MNRRRSADSSRRLFRDLHLHLRILHADRRRAHAVALVLIGVSYAIALIQVRGAIFANLLAIHRWRC